MNKNTNGFTIIEIIVVVVIIGILVSLGSFSYTRIIASSRDSERDSKIKMISAALEKYYDEHGEYPSCSKMSQQVDNITSSTLVGLSSDVFATPTSESGENSFISLCGDLTENIDAFAYIGDGSSVCLEATDDSGACAQYTLKYVEEKTGNIIEVNSKRGQNTALTVLSVHAGTGGTVTGGGTYAANSSRTITATPSSGYIFSSWSGSTGCSGTASHSITMDANKSCTANFTKVYTLTVTAGTGGTVTGGGTYTANSSRTITATPNTYYSFSSWTGSTGCAGTASHSITMDANKSCTANFVAIPIATPTMTTISVSASNPEYTSLSFSWPAVACPSGTTAMYKYLYSRDNWTDIWRETQNLYLNLTVYQGYQNNLEVGVRCYNSATTSALSSTQTKTITTAVNNYIALRDIRWSYSRIDNKTISLQASTHCSSGMVKNMYTDIYSESWVWPDYGVAGWYLDRFRKAPSTQPVYYTSWPSSTSVQATSETGIPTNTRWRQGAYLHCVNPVTSRHSFNSNILYGDFFYAL